MYPLLYTMFLPYCELTLLYNISQFRLFVNIHLLIYFVQSPMVATAYKLGVNIFDYICDRVSRANQMPSLASLIEQKAAERPLGHTFPPRPP
jgi:hypothetical protein